MKKGETPNNMFLCCNSVVCGKDLFSQNLHRRGSDSFLPSDANALTLPIIGNRVGGGKTSLGILLV